jgi:NarL family two-component system response regulator LiaR
MAEVTETGHEVPGVLHEPVGVEHQEVPLGEGEPDLRARSAARRAEGDARDREVAGRDAVGRDQERGQVARRGQGAGAVVGVEVGDEGSGQAAGSRRRVRRRGEDPQGGLRQRGGRGRGEGGRAGQGGDEGPSATVGPVAVALGVDDGQVDHPAGQPGPVPGIPEERSLGPRRDAPGGQLEPLGGKADHRRCGGRRAHGPSLLGLPGGRLTRSGDFLGDPVGYNGPMSPLDDQADPDRRPLRVALANDYELVLAGLARLLEPYGDRVAVSELDVRRGPEQPCDVCLFDTYGRADDGLAQVERLAEDPRVGAVAVYTWVLRPSLERAYVAAGARGVVSKTLPAADLVVALERLARGELVLARGPRRDGDTTWPGRKWLLTRRESEVLALLTTGMSNREIAAALFLSEHTVRSHLKAIFRKLQVANRSQAATSAILDPDFARRFGTPGQPASSSDLAALVEERLDAGDAPRGDGVEEGRLDGASR